GGSHPLPAIFPSRNPTSPHSRSQLGSLASLADRSDRFLYLGFHSPGECPWPRPDLRLGGPLYHGFCLSSLPAHVAPGADGSETGRRNVSDDARRNHYPNDRDGAHGIGELGCPCSLGRRNPAEPGYRDLCGTTRRDLSLEWNSLGTLYRLCDSCVDLVRDHGCLQPLAHGEYHDCSLEGRPALLHFDLPDSFA